MSDVVIVAIISGLLTGGVLQGIRALFLTPREANTMTANLEKAVVDTAGQLVDRVRRELTEVSDQLERAQKRLAELEAQNAELLRLRDLVVRLQIDLDAVTNERDALRAEVKTLREKVAEIDRRTP